MKELKAVEIEINSHCNRACSYCPNTNQSRIEQGVMVPEVFEKILSQLKDLNYEGRVSFSFYNEPLLVPNLGYFIRRAKEVLPRIKIHIYSNGTLLTRNLLERLLNDGVDHFIITRHENEEHFPFEEMHKSLPRVVANKITYKHFSELKLTNRGGLVEHIKKEIDVAQLPCVIPSNMITITNKGTIVPCFEDYHQVHSMGNINEKSLMEIWESKEYVIFRKKLMMGLRKDYDVCSKCNRTEMIGVH